MAFLLCEFVSRAEPMCALHGVVHGLAAAGPALTLSNLSRRGLVHAGLAWLIVALMGVACVGLAWPGMA